MNKSLGLIVYLGIILAFLQNYLIIVVGLVLFYSFRFGPGALIPLAILLDGYYGNFYGIPYLSISSIVWYVVMVYARVKVVNLKFG